MIIDDEPAIARMITRVLSDDHIELAKNGTEALARFESDTRFDVVLCDMRMPDMSGLDVYEHVVSRWPTLARRFVFVTGGVVDADAEEALEALPNHSLEKPFKPAALRAAVTDAATDFEARR